MGATLPRSARAIEAFDGRVQMHGYFEVQLRALARNYGVNSDEWGLAQWYNILNLEFEADVAPDGWGPFSAISAFARVEVRYDCVWRSACGTLSTPRIYGDRAKTGPKWLTNASESNLAGTTVGVPNPEMLLPGQRLTAFSNFAPFDTFFEARGADQCYDDGRGPACQPIINPAGPVCDSDGNRIPDDNNFNGIPDCTEAPGTPLLGQAAKGIPPSFLLPINRQDDPGAIVFGPYGDYGFYGKNQGGPADGQLGTPFPLGPWRPKDKVYSTGILRTRTNSLSPFESSPQRPVEINGGAYPYSILPFRQVPNPNPPNAFSGGANTQISGLLAASEDKGQSKRTPQGLYYPNPGLRQELLDSDLQDMDVNFDQISLEFNRGASQKLGELKELYGDFELFDGQLWIRAGYQTIVWGKTEIFRNQDQFNPQDFGLASLPSLEESRISLWALRAVWSFWSVGPFEDVRLEVGLNIDEFEPVDIGRCGEPFSPLPSCLKSFGALAHGLTGTGLAGERRPDPAWESFHGLEGGARLEFRWDRFSFALSDFYGYNDFPHAEVLWNYQRNVDPYTGRPRRSSSPTGCDPNGDQRGCMGPAAGPLGEIDPAHTAGAVGFGQYGNPLYDDGVTTMTEMYEERAQNYFQNRGLTSGYDDDGDGIIDRTFEGATVANGPCDGVNGAGNTACPLTTLTTANINDVLLNHAANQSLFHTACAGTFGLTDLFGALKADCALSAFSSGASVNDDLGVSPSAVFPLLSVANGNSLILSATSSTIVSGASTAFRLSAGSPLDSMGQPVGQAQNILRLVPLNSDDNPNAGTFLVRQDPRFLSINPNGTNRSACPPGFNPTFAAAMGGATAAPGGSICGFRTDSLEAMLTPEQQALLGCGPFYGTSCDHDGLDLLNAEASAILQAFPGFDGTPIKNYDVTIPCVQPGTIPSAFSGVGNPCGPLGAVPEFGPVGTRYVEGFGLLSLPGACGPGPDGVAGGGDDQCYGRNWNPAIDGDPVFSSSSSTTDFNNKLTQSVQTSTQTIAPVNCPGVSAGMPLIHPWTCELFASEMSVLSFNLLNVIVAASGDIQGDSPTTYDRPQGDPTDPGWAPGTSTALDDGVWRLSDCLGAVVDTVNPQNTYIAVDTADKDEFNPCLPLGTETLRIDGTENGACGYITPQYCAQAAALFNLAGNRRNDVRAGGTSRFGRRDFLWHGAQSLVLDYSKNNYLGFSMDFAEDVTKSNVGIEMTWVKDLQFDDAQSDTNLSTADEYRLTVSIDRPTFINFLNANRSFFINTQWFFSYRYGFRQSFSANGPWNILGTLTAFTGYFQDRLMMFWTWVYDFQSNSGAGLPSFVYRFTESFSAQFGLAFFWGREQRKQYPIMPRAVTNNAESGAYHTFVENGLAVVRQRDEVYLRIRWTF